LPADRITGLRRDTSHLCASMRADLGFDLGGLPSKLVSEDRLKPYAHPLAAESWTTRIEIIGKAPS
jgi:hypothetical protein